MIDGLRELFNRDLKRLTREIEAFDDEAAIWQTRGNVKNSSGNLCLHLCGNLQTYIGALLGETGYVRDRVAEFSLKNLPREQLLKHIQKTAQVVDQTVVGLSAERLDALYPQEVLGKPMSVRFFLLHLYGHLNYHLGQINYLRRMISR